MGMLNFGLLLVISMLISCAQNRSYLTKEEKSWNPYKKDQLLIFESSYKDRDTLRIEALNADFPDGLGVVEYNESLYVLAHLSGSNLGKHFSDVYDILKIVARTDKTPSYVEYRINLKNTKLVGGQRVYFDDLYKLEETTVNTPFGQLDDVISITNQIDSLRVPTAINVFYWSKSRGYIRLESYDGIIWQLVEIIEPNDRPS